MCEEVLFHKVKTAQGKHSTKVGGADVVGRIKNDKVSLEKQSTRIQIHKEKKIRSIPLKVSAPFHCSLMKPAALKMADKINSVNFKKPNFDIVCNVTSKPENDPESIKKLLIEQICSTVRWRESILNMSQENISNFVEIGPGKVLSGLVKRINKEVKIDTINNQVDIEGLKI